MRLTRYHVLPLLLFALLVGAALRLPDLMLAPPGVHYDEAANGILAAEIGLQGERPLFISSYTGKEVLFFYLAGGVMALLGPTTFALRLTAAFVGLLTLAATYWLGLELLRDRRVALLAVTLLTISFWHLLFSRLGFRAITQPLLQALTLAALLRGLRTDDRRWLLAAGLFLGLTGYTYLAARLFPVLLLLAALPLLRHKKRWGQLSPMIGIAAIVLAPLLYYFYNNPDAFWVRITQVSPADGLSLQDSFIRSLEMFFLLGDPYNRFNLPFRPLFNWFWGGLLLVGFVPLLRWWRRGGDWSRTAVLLLILNPLIMLLPTALATNEIVPSNLRAIGMIPLLFYLPPLGLLLLLEDVAPRMPSLPSLGRMVLAGGVIILVVGGLFVDRLYFRQWAQRPDVYLETDGDMSAVATYLDENPFPDSTIYLASPHYRHPTVAFLSEKYPEVKWLPEGEALVFPSSGSAVYLFPAKSPFPGWAASFFVGGQLLDTPNQPDGAAAFIGYQLLEPPHVSLPHETAVTFGGSITLQGFDFAAARDGMLPITLYWRVDSAVGGNFTPFVHLEDRAGYRWSQVETFAYPAEQWAAGERIVQRVEVPLPAGTPPGDYRLRVGLFEPETGDRLPRLDGAGRYAGDSAVLYPVTLPAAAPPAQLPAPPVAREADVWPQLRLLGFEPAPAQVATGERLPFALWWEATAVPPATTSRIELIPADRPGQILTTLQPVYDSFPFTEWPTPLFLIDRQAPQIPADFPAGEYEIILRMLDSLETTRAEISLGWVTVAAAERIFTPPPVDNGLQATFGGEIALLGYNLVPAEEAEQWRLQLVWQALRAPAADYTVFVHLLAADGLCAPCVWQQDAMPQQNGYPTSRWVEDEVVVDEYLIVVPPETVPGDYLLEVGLYVAENGRRLQARQPDQPPADQVYLQPLRVE